MKKAEARYITNEMLDDRTKDEPGNRREAQHLSFCVIAMMSAHFQREYSTEPHQYEIQLRMKDLVIILDLPNEECTKASGGYREYYISGSD